ncbi:MAG: phosphomevalonate kinase [Candidatus Sericytochromatia bacterium]|nr:phosphomevalonate kinase [Candidatus Sericytochromatia bacterium]
MTALMPGMLRLRVPGKLMLAGEYAVLEPHQPALVVAVDRYVEAVLARAEAFTVSLPGYDMMAVGFEPGPGGLAFASDDPRLRFVGEALAVALAAVGRPVPPFSLTLHSGLDDAQGRKFGLGGSAAAVVAVVAAVLNAFEGPAAPMRVFKAAAVAHLRAQGGGSGADVAAATFGGWLRYASFNPTWLAGRLARGGPLAELLAEAWPFLSVERLSPLPRDLRLCVGWTGEPASTQALLPRVAEVRTRAPQAYEDFLGASRAAVEHLTAGLQSANRFRALDALRRNGAALRRLGEVAAVPIVTPALQRLIDAAEEAGGAGKSSGAGGGDCGVALVFGEVEALRLEAAWLAAGIVPLRLGTSDAGVAVTELAP